MPDTIQAKRERRAALAAKTRALIDKTPSAKWGETEQREYDSNMAEIERIDAEIKRESRLMDLEAEQTFKRARGGKTSDSEPGSRTEWQDSDGRPVVALGPNDRLADLVQARSQDQEEQLPPDALGRMVKAMVTGDSRALEAVGREYPMQAMTTGRDTDGGVWIAPSVATSIIDAARAQSVIIQGGARTVEMTSPEMKLVRVLEDAKPGWLGEKQKGVEDSPGFGALRLVAKKLYVVVPVASELFEDAENLGNELNRLLAEAFAAELDRAGLVGDGKDGAPIGIRNYPGTLAESGTPYDYELLLDALEKVEGANFQPSALVQPPALARALRGLREGDGTGQYLAPPPDLAEVPRMVTTRLPDEAAILGDLREMVIGVRSNFSLLVSQAARLERDTVLIAARWRGDIGIARPKALCNLTVTE